MRPESWNFILYNISDPEQNQCPLDFDCQTEMVAILNSISNNWGAPTQFGFPTLPGGGIWPL